MKENLIEIATNERIMDSLKDYVKFREDEIKNQIVGTSPEGLQKLQGMFLECGGLVKYIEMLLGEQRKELALKEDEDIDIIRGY